MEKLKGQKVADFGRFVRNGLYGCRPFCKRFLTFLVSDRVRTSVRPLFAAQRPLAGMVIRGLDPSRFRAGEL